MRIIRSMEGQNEEVEDKDKYKRTGMKERMITKM
jgi:hypothetical protein